MPKPRLMPFWLILMELICLVPARAGAGERDGESAAVKTERFDRDPGWEAHNTGIAPRPQKEISQNFGYTSSGFAGKGPGEIGGTVWRDSTPASYADQIATKTLDDPLSASGTFAIT